MRPDFSFNPAHPACGPVTIRIITHFSSIQDCAFYRDSSSPILTTPRQPIANFPCGNKKKDQVAGIRTRILRTAGIIAGYQIVSSSFMPSDKEKTQKTRTGKKAKYT